MLESGRHLWNANLFLFSTDATLAAFETHAPDLLAGERPDPTRKASPPKAPTTIDRRNMLLRAEFDNQQLVAMGLADIVAIAMCDAVFITHKDRMQLVKHAVIWSKIASSAMRMSTSLAKPNRIVLLGAIRGASGGGSFTIGEPWHRVILTASDSIAVLHFRRLGQPLHA